MKTIRFISIMMMFVAWSCSSNEGLSLKGTKWKLAGIVDAQTGELTELEPKNCAECFTLTFDTNTTAHGKSIQNHVVILGLDPVSIVIATDVLDGPDGDIFCDIVQTALFNSYTLTINELKFFYNNNNNYLLYKRINQ